MRTATGSRDTTSSPSTTTPATTDRPPAETRPIRRWLPAASVATTVAVIVAVWELAAALDAALPNWAEHAASHLAVGLPVTGLAIVALRWWPPPPPSPLATAARRVLVAAIVALAIFQLLESLSARLEYPRSGWLHTTTGLLTMVAVAGTALAAAMVGASRLFHGGVPRGARTTLLVLGALLALGAFATMTGAVGVVVDR